MGQLRYGKDGFGEVLSGEAVEDLSGSVRLGANRHGRACTGGVR